MKFTIGYAKNEAFELIFGNVLIGIGGFLVGLAYSNSDLFSLIYLAFIIFGFGILFDVRVLRKFAYKLSIVKESVEKVLTDLHNAKTALEKTQKGLDESEKKMKKAEEKIFGTGGSTFSRSSWAHPIEEKVEELKKKVDDLTRKLNNLENERRYDRSRFRV